MPTDGETRRHPVSLRNQPYHGTAGNGEKRQRTIMRWSSAPPILVTKAADFRGFCFSGAGFSHHWHAVACGRREHGVTVRAPFPFAYVVEAVADRKWATTGRLRGTRPSQADPVAAGRQWKRVRSLGRVEKRRTPLPPTSIGSKAITAHPANAVVPTSPGSSTGEGGYRDGGAFTEPASTSRPAASMRSPP